MYGVLLVTHLLAAIAFIGTLFFEVFIWHAARRPLTQIVREGADQAIAQRSRHVLHGVVLVLYGAGMALAGKLKDQNYRVVVLMSDGECNEGSVWEAALFAPARGLDNLAVVIDYNKWQATGRSNEVFRLEPLKDKWLAAGWSAHDVDGHDIARLVDLLSRVPDGSSRPVAIIAHTVKGKGVSFMEDNNDWHYRPPNDADLQNARRELGLL